MRLTVNHRTTYRYARPMRTLVQSVRLYPSRFDGQETVDWQVSVEGFGEVTRSAEMEQHIGGMTQSMGRGAQILAAGDQAHVGAAFRDGAGDWTETISVRGPVDAVAIEVTGTVETRDLAGVLRGHREAVPPGAYLRKTRATDPDVALTELARKTIAATEGGTVLNRAHALMGAVAGAIAYAPGETEAETTAAEALAHGRGVCQDHAHALIALAHLAAIPARYVVGYLHAQQGAEASHAWAELWIDGLGWVGFDAANECCPDDRYIRLCSGFDAQDAAPLRGVAAGSQPEEMEVAVAVQRQSQ